MLRCDGKIEEKHVPGYKSIVHATTMMGTAYEGYTIVPAICTTCGQHQVAKRLIRRVK